MISRKNKFPIKVWLDSREDIEEGCLEQAGNLSNLPFLHKWVALMPDTHMGKGMPIGGVIATKDVIIPNAVGVDIGCGMAFVETDVKADRLRGIKTPNGSLIQGIIGDILRNIPVGFSHHREKQTSKVLDEAMGNMMKYQEAENLLKEIEDGYYQIGTLGGGNHFIELQENEEGYVCIMLHSGSRHFGYKVCNHYHNLARELGQKWYTSVPDHYRLAFLPIESKEGIAYIHWMNLALDFAHENRRSMMEAVMLSFDKWVKKHGGGAPTYKEVINCHHNYAALEEHYGEKVWVHRKGAICAEKDRLGIIPGAMGSYSYIVKGKGNPDSFNSCSHGAGRLMSRKKAMETIRVDEVMNDLKANQVVLGKRSKHDVPEESRYAYKDIDQVMANQVDLVEPVMKLKTIGVVKG